MKGGILFLSWILQKRGKRELKISHEKKTEYEYGFVVACQERLPVRLRLLANLIPGTHKDRIDEVLDMVRLSRRAKDKVRTYSLGMKQRLGIANALLGHPKQIILDEPTNGLTLKA